MVMATIRTVTYLKDWFLLCGAEAAMACCSNTEFTYHSMEQLQNVATWNIQISMRLILAVATSAPLPHHTPYDCQVELKPNSCFIVISD